MALSIDGLVFAARASSGSVVQRTSELDDEIEAEKKKISGKLEEVKERREEEIHQPLVAGIWRSGMCHKESRAKGGMAHVMQVHHLIGSQH